jgi:hypothetical protein
MYIEQITRKQLLLAYRDENGNINTSQLLVSSRFSMSKLYKIFNKIDTVMVFVKSVRTNNQLHVSEFYRCYKLWS